MCSSFHLFQKWVRMFNPDTGAGTDPEPDPEMPEAEFKFTEDDNDDPQYSGPASRKRVRYLKRAKI